MNKIINGALQKISRYDEFPIINWSDTGKLLMNVDFIGTKDTDIVTSFQKTIILKENDDISYEEKHDGTLTMYDLTYIKNPNYYIDMLNKYDNTAFCINLTKRYNVKNLNDFYIISHYANSVSSLDSLLFAELIKYDSLLYNID